MYMRQRPGPRLSVPPVTTPPNRQMIAFTAFALCPPTSASTSGAVSSVQSDCFGTPGEPGRRDRGGAGAAHPRRGRRSAPSGWRPTGWWAERGQQADGRDRLDAGRAVEPADRDVPAPPAQGLPRADGRLHLQSWEDRETGQHRFKTVVRAEEVLFLGTPGAAGTLKTY